jgi:hypothetical protein
VNRLAVVGNEVYASCVSGLTALGPALLIARSVRYQCR